MHSHETPSDKSDRNPPLRPQHHRARPGAVPVGATAAAVLNLQRLAGNAAVTKALGQDHEHGAGCHHGTPVQRSSVLDVLRTPGAPVDPRIRAKAEQGLGTDLGDVRVHDGPEAHRSAAELGARAYTSGRHIVAGEQGMDEHTLLHELTHTWQQQRGQVAGTDNGAGLRVSAQGDRHENEAESYAHLLAKVPAPTAGAGERVGGGRAFGERSAPPSVHAGPSVQRVPTGDLEEGGVARSDGRESGALVSALKLLAEVLPEAAPLIVQGIGNALVTAEGGKIYAAGVALNGAVGLSEIVKACYRIYNEPDHVPSYVKILFGALNLAGSVTYGHSQTLEGYRKTVQSALGAIMQGLSYVGIIVTNRYIAKKDDAKSEELRSAGTSTGFSARPQQGTLRRRGQGGDFASGQVTARPAPARLAGPPQLPPLELPDWRLG
ncbi:eCIS core domain-containing protein [Streptomyces sp. NPDC001493]